MPDTPTPLYQPTAAGGAYQLRYSWTAWPSKVDFAGCPVQLLTRIAPFWETDGLRLLEFRWLPDKLQILFSATPAVSPMFLAARAKGRLDHAIRQAGLKDKSLAINKWIAKAILDHGWATFRAELLSLIRDGDNETIERGIRLVDQLCLARLRQELNAQEKVAARETCRALAEAAVAALRRVDAMVPQYAWQADGVNRAWLLPRLLRTLLAGGFEDLLGQVLEHVQQDRKHDPLLGVQYAALKTMGPWLRNNVTLASIPLTQWIAACRAKLAAETAAEPEPPRDFRREFAGTCKCADCAELKQFLLDDSEAEHRFQMAQHRRDHLQGQINRHQLDLDCKTDRKPRPQVLVCTKNTATYGRSLKTYRDNLRRLKLLRELEEALPG